MFPTLDRKHIVGLLVVMLLWQSGMSAEPSRDHFITRKAGRLYAGDREFRFISFNIPNLHTVEDNFMPGAATPWCWPNEYEISDALESVRQMGGTVVRSYVLGVRRTGADMADHVFVLAPGQFNEAAFRSLDQLLQIAGQKNIRVIIPLVDQWRWWGGIEQYAAFRDQPAEAFWNDPRIIADFQETIRHTLARVNTRTRVRYADDPAILGWETGNELDAPLPWTEVIASTIRQLAPRQLIIDGRSLHGISAESVTTDKTDVLTTHHYPGPGRDMVAEIRDALTQVNARKPYFVGEFGFVPQETVRSVLDTVIDSPCSGALLWSLRYHHRDGGFYVHSEPAVMGRFRAYHWPGFASGNDDERAVLHAMRTAAFRIRGMEPPPMLPPATPTELHVSTDRSVRFRGVAGASSYRIERRSSSEESWSRVAPDVDDSRLPYRPPWHDLEAQPHVDYWYRVIARNAAGDSAASAVFGPLRFDRRKLVDEFDIRHPRATWSDGVQVVDDNARSFREDPHRLALGRGQSVIYHVPGEVLSATLRYFQPDPRLHLEWAGATGSDFELLSITPEVVSDATGDYGYAREMRVRVEFKTPRFRRLRLMAWATEAGHSPAETEELQPVQLSWLEIEYPERPAGP